ncbi:hypothetical protein C7H09_02500 [Marinobacter fuscus]|uniref:Cytochrome oxidase assembly protein n=1 Tax=Marinobacter fuscus TaxID=2109942 RepID=A0A2T1KUT4_9GAMM|nr:hypothetical protein [Marinobacter fuscus]PSF13492.1 hypothetical protein C7H09_02500 [Marinobacter fuscus]
MTTTTADSIPDIDGPTPEQVSRGRRTAMLLFAVGFGPMLLATLMYYTGWLNPASQTNEGDLLQPVVPVQALHLETLNGQPLETRFGVENTDAKWLMLVVSGTCGDDCEQLLYLARQVNIALGKNAPRVGRAAYLDARPTDLERRWAREYNLMERLQAQSGQSPAWPAGIRPAQNARLLLVDPNGNIVMHYGVEHTGKQMLKDLKHLLKLSQIG